MNSYPYGKVNEIPYENVDTLIDALFTVGMPPTPLSAMQIGERGCVFRGQSDASWTLCPFVFREDSNIEKFSMQYPGTYDKSIEEQLYNRDRTYLLNHQVSEIASVRHFTQEADRQGLETPLEYYQVKEQYEQINKNFAALRDAYEMGEPLDPAWYDAVFPHSKLITTFCLCPA